MTAYILILTAFGDMGMAVGTSQARFDTLEACQAAGKAAQDAAGSYSWSKGMTAGFGSRITFHCAPTDLKEHG